MKTFALLFGAFILLIPNKGWGDNFYPVPLLLLDDYFSHHVLIAEKSTHTLHLFKNDDGHPQLIKTYQMATGKKTGDKLFQGDHRTPEGIYYFQDILTHQQLIERHGKKAQMYGVGAFVMNYPNPVDLALKKTGSGIWLHSTNDETRIEKGLDSRGCLVIANDDLKDVSQYLELNRSFVVIVQNIFYLKKDVWQKKRDSIKALVESWVKAWREEDLKTYMSHYHPREFSHRIRGHFQQFYRYKKAVFAQPGAPTVELDNLNIMASKNYAVASFRQTYHSHTINDTGHKRLYLKRDDFYHWKIIAEVWSKAGIGPSHLAFQPSMRFFKQPFKPKEKEQKN